MPDLLLETSHCSHRKTVDGCQDNVLTGPCHIAGVPCIWGHYWHAGASPMSTTPTLVAKTRLVSPLNWRCPCLDTAHHPGVIVPTEVAILPYWLSAKIFIQPKALRCVWSWGRADCSLVSPWRGWHCVGRWWGPWLCCEYWPPQPHLIPSLPPSVPQRGFKVLWLPLCGCSSATDAILTSELSLNFAATTEACIGHVHAGVPVTTQCRKFSPEWCSVTRILAPGVTIKAQLWNICSNDEFIALLLLFWTMVIAWVSGRPCS